MTQVTEAGAVVYPMIPTFYNVPQTVEQMYEEFTARLLGFLGLDQTNYYAWGGVPTQAQQELGDVTRKRPVPRRCPGGARRSFRGGRANVRRLVPFLVARERQRPDLSVADSHIAARPRRAPQGGVHLRAGDVDQSWRVPASSQRCGTTCSVGRQTPDASRAHAGRRWSAAG